MQISFSCSKEEAAIYTKQAKNNQRTRSSFIAQVMRATYGPRPDSIKPMKANRKPRK